MSDGGKIGFRVFCVGAGVARMGFVADLISKPVRIGYLAGLAITIFVDQLPKLFGFSVDADRLIEELVAVLTNLGQTNPFRHTDLIRCT